MRLRPRRLAAAAIVIAIVAALSWYESQPRVAAGQPSLVTLDSSSLSMLRDEFNRDASHARLIVLVSPT
jgi:hypothetical protein